MSRYPLFQRIGKILFQHVLSATCMKRDIRPIANMPQPRLGRLGVERWDQRICTPMCLCGSAIMGDERHSTRKGKDIPHDVEMAV